MKRTKDLLAELTKENEELSLALVNATRVIAAQALELVELKEEKKASETNTQSLVKTANGYAEKIKALLRENQYLKREHIATTKSVRQKAVAYLDENGDMILIGQEAFKKAGFVSGRDRLINDSWQPLGIIPKIEETEVN